MSANSKIEWTDHTFNTHWGCSKVGPGCDGCYAERLAARFGYGWGDDAPKREFDEKHWEELLRWDRKAQAEGVRRRVFTNSMSDLFDKFAPDGVRERHFDYVERTPHLDHLLLTKRIGNVRKMVPAHWLKPGGWPAHVRIGATIVNQEEADRDIPKLLALPCSHFLSMEPLLGPVDLTAVWVANGILRNMVPAVDRLQWVIVGGESGTNARPMHPEWVRSLRDQCEAAGVPFLFKQWGEWQPMRVDSVPSRGGSFNLVSVDKRRPIGSGCFQPAHALEAMLTDSKFSWQCPVVRVGKKASGRVLDGCTWDGFPA